MISGLISSARPREWLKNGFVLAPLFFSNNLWDISKYPAVILTFIGFCLASSSVYLLNDVLDRQADSLHPEKKSRPIASGQLPPGMAVASSLLLALAAHAAVLTVNRLTLACVIGYLLLSIAYCFVLKHLIVLDVTAIAAGFVVRAVAGAVAIQVYISPWIIICTFTLAVFISLCKRYHELNLLADTAEAHRTVLSHYSVELLRFLIVLAAAITVAVYILYVLFPVPDTPANRHNLWITVPFVFLGIARYVHLVLRQNRGGIPSEVLLKDPMLAGIVGGWILTLSVIFIL